MSADDAAPAPSRRWGQWVIWLFAAVGLVGILCIIALTVTLFGIERPYRPAEVAAEKKETVFTVSAPQDLPGTNLMHLDVNAAEGTVGSSSLSRGRGDQRNVLLLDKQTGASRRILPDNEHRILQARFLPAQAEIADRAETDLTGETVSRAGPAAYYLLEIAQPDRPERLDILVGAIAGGRQGYVMRDLDGVDTVWMQSPTRIGLVVRERLGLYFRVIDVPTLKVVQSQRIKID